MLCRDLLMMMMAPNRRRLLDKNANERAASWCRSGFWAAAAAATPKKIYRVFVNKTCDNRCWCSFVLRKIRLWYECDKIPMKFTSTTLDWICLLLLKHCCVGLMRELKTFYVGMWNGFNCLIFFIRMRYFFKNQK